MRFMLLLLCCGALSGVSQAQERRVVETVAHRGESHDAPENTLAAFRLAWERNVTTIELDVHLTQDGVLLCTHDADTKRTTGVSKRIKETSLSELKKLDAGKWKNDRFTGERMPTLAEALATVPETGRVLIEIKVGPEAVPALVADVEQSGKRPDQLILISFNAEALAEAKRKLPKLKAYFLSGFKRDEKSGTWQPTAEALIQQAKTLGVEGLDLSATGPVDADFVKQVKAAGLELHVWTVDDPARAKELVAAGVDSITTNRAAWLKKELEK